MSPPPKILFLCGSLEPGKSGVGDYTRTLAQELLRLYGIQSMILALNDGSVNERTESDRNKTPSVPEIRLPQGSEKNWRKETDKIIQDFAPDWVSLQYVGYSYNTYGCGYPITRLLETLPKTIKLHIMFHELWEGFGVNDSLKVRVRGFLQKRSVKKLVSTSKPSIIHTQNAFYVKQLRKLGTDAKYLPLFGNIPIATKDTNRALALIQKTGTISATQAERHRYLVFIFFGSIYPSWPGEELMNYVHGALPNLEKRVLFLSIGKLGAQRGNWDSLRKRYSDYFEFVELGFLETSEISILLQEADFGVATTPFEALGKSGSFITMQEHGLPVFASQGMLRENKDGDCLDKEPNAYPINRDAIAQIHNPPEKGSQQSRLPQTIHSFVKDLNLL